MELRFCPLFSGSSGNCLFVGNDKTRLLVDAGLPGKTILDALFSIGERPGMIDGILITHEHTDHVAGVGVLARKLGVPIYANGGTWAAMESKIGAVPSRLMRCFDTGQNFYIKDLDIIPFKTPHDAKESVGFVIESRGRSVAVATDLGHMTKTVFAHISEADVVLLESNHDKDMLKACAYPSYLKARIAGKHGHLSNDDCANTLVLLAKAGVKSAILGHLSGEANTPEIALSLSRQRLTTDGIVPDRDIRISLALRHQVGAMQRIV